MLCAGCGHLAPNRLARGSECASRRSYGPGSFYGLQQRYVLRVIFRQDNRANVENLQAGKYNEKEL